MPGRRSTLRAERARVARAIAAALLAGGPATFIGVACNSTLGTSLDANDAGKDAIASESAANDESSAGESGVACQISVSTFDSGIYMDAEGGVVDVGCIYDLPCGLPPTVVAIGCQVYTPDPQADAFYPLYCTVPEGLGCADGSFVAVDGGLVGLICNDCLGGGGRTPRGLRKITRTLPKNAVGAYFAKMAHEESASVHAFVRMKDELVRFGAPRELCAAALRAIADEQRHARVMSRLAHRHRIASAPARTRAHRNRSLEAMAIENAVEGCVRETFGALLLRWQGEHAPDAALRRTFVAIARDEERHAALSWALASWIETQLDDAANARVRRARRRAALQIARSPKWLENRSFVRVLGRPDPTAHARLASALAQSLDL